MGTRVTRAAAHFTVEEVKQRMKLDPRFWVRQRWWIIYNALIAPRKAEEIATAEQIQQDFEVTVKHEVHISTI